MDKPKVIQDREAELAALVEKYPYTIPVEEVAKFLRIDSNRLRKWAYRYPNNPFAIGIQAEDARHNDYCRVDTLAFYNYHIK